MVKSNWDPSIHQAYQNCLTIYYTAVKLTRVKYFDNSALIFETQANHLITAR